MHIYSILQTIFFISFAIISEQANSEKDVLQKSVDTQLGEHKSETDKLKEELKRKLQTAAEQHDAKLQAEISKGKLFNCRVKDDVLVLYGVV